jgi:hypothetical protein
MLSFLVGFRSRPRCRIRVSQVMTLRYNADIRVDAEELSVQVLDTYARVQGHNSDSRVDERIIFASVVIVTLVAALMAICVSRAPPDCASKCGSWCKRWPTRMNRSE